MKAKQLSLAKLEAAERTEDGLIPGLNERQTAACLLKEGPIMVVAGPGTGKTRVVTYRFRELIRSGVPPESILVLTFTEKAATEMEQRIVHLSDLNCNELAISTFHSFALRFLEEEGLRLPILPQPFRIATEAERWAIMAGVIEGTHIAIDPGLSMANKDKFQQEWRSRLRQAGLYRLPRPHDIVPHLLKLIERAKQELIGPADYAQWATDRPRSRWSESDREIEIARIYAAYQSMLSRGGLRANQMGKEGLIDFDDTISMVANLLQGDPELLEKARKRFPYVMVDEFQDTNYAQLRLVELIAGEGQGNVLVVGDDDQAIYRFRGASLASLRRFEKTYPNRIQIELDTNYRSTSPIVIRAQNLIKKNNKVRITKPNQALVGGAEIRLFHAPDQPSEDSWIADRIQELIAAGTPAGEIAILGRANSHLRTPIQLLQVRNIPYQIYGGRGFMEQPEIRDLRAMLRVLVDSEDSIAWARILSMPAFEIPPKLIEKACRDSSELNIGLEEMVEYYGKEQKQEASFRFSVLHNMVRDLRSHVQRERVDEIIKRILDETGFVGLLNEQTELGREQAGANIAKFANMALNFCQGDLTGDRSSVRDFVAYLQTVETSGSEQGLATVKVDRQAVQVMTVHQAKGLEFTVVFCPCWAEERFPMRPQSELLSLPNELLKEELPEVGQQHAYEERRLGYVAITRAKEHLLISYADQYGAGARHWRPSPFLYEMGIVDREGHPIGGVRDEPMPVAIVPDPQMAVLAEQIPQDLVTSYSDLNEYGTCPRRYQYRKVYGLPGGESSEKQFGTVIHSTLSQILAKATKQPLSEQEAVDVFIENFRLIRFPDLANRTSWQERGENMIRNLHRRGRLSSALILEREFRLRLDFDGPAPIEAGERVKFTVVGRIDRVDPPDVGGYHNVIDYKTGQVGRPSELSRDLQMGIYAMAAKQSLRLDKIKLRICDVEGNEHEVVKTPAQLEVDRRSAAELARGIVSKNFPAKPNVWKCSSCAYRLLCPDAL